MLPSAGRALSRLWLSGEESEGEPMSYTGEGRRSGTAGFLERRGLVLRAIYRLAAIAAVAAMAFAPVGPALGVALADPVSPIAVTKTATPSPVASGPE